MRYSFFFILFTTVACGEAPTPASTPEPVSPTDSTGELQGTWWSVDEEESTIRFEGNLMISGYPGQPDEPENYLIAATCAQAPEGAPREDGKYLVVPDAGRCYYLLSLTNTELEMSYVGSGDTLRYTKILAGD